MGWFASAMLASVLVLEPAVAERDPDRALTLLRLAQDARREGNPEQALRDLASAIEADPELAAAYLTRAQVIIDMSGDLESPPADAEARAQWTDRLELAAGDLEQYGRLAHPDGTIADAINRERQSLLDAIARSEMVEPEEEEPEEEEPEEEEPEEDAPPRPVQPPEPLVDTTPSRARLGPWFVTTGTLATAAGIGLLSAGLLIDKSCPDGLCAARWNNRTGLIGGGVSAATLGATLLTLGAVDYGRHGAQTPKAVRGRRATGITLLTLGGATLVTSAVLGGLASARWNTVLPSDSRGLGRTQALANATLALSSAIPSLIATGVALLVAKPGRRGVASARIAARRWTLGSF